MRKLLETTNFGNSLANYHSPHIMALARPEIYKFHRMEQLQDCVPSVCRVVLQSVHWHQRQWTGLSRVDSLIRRTARLLLRECVRTRFGVQLPQSAHVGGRVLFGRRDSGNCQTRHSDADWWVWTARGQNQKLRVIHTTTESNTNTNTNPDPDTKHKHSQCHSHCLSVCVSLQCVSSPNVGISCFMSSRFMRFIHFIYHRPLKRSSIGVRDLIIIIILCGGLICGEHIHRKKEKVMRDCSDCVICDCFVGII